MISLFGTKQTIEVLLAGAITTTELPVTASYEDMTGGPGKPIRRTTHGPTTGATAMVALAAPASGTTRSLEGLVVHNADSVTQTVTARLSDTNTGVAVTRTLFKGALLTLETLYYTKQRGFFVLDANGLEKTSASGNSTTTSTAASLGTSAGLAASVATSVATSLDTAEDVTVSVADSKGVSAGLATSVALSTAASAGLATSVADSKAVSDGLAASVALSTAASTGLAASVATSTNVVQSTAISTSVSTDSLHSSNFSRLKSSNNGTGLP